MHVPSSPDSSEIHRRIHKQMHRHKHALKLSPPSYTPMPTGRININPPSLFTKTHMHKHSNMWTCRHPQDYSLLCALRQMRDLNLKSLKSSNTNFIKKLVSKAVWLIMARNKITEGWLRQMTRPLAIITHAALGITCSSKPSTALFRAIQSEAKHSHVPCTQAVSQRQYAL